MFSHQSFFLVLQSLKIRSWFYTSCETYNITGSCGVFCRTIILANLLTNGRLEPIRDERDRTESQQEERGHLVPPANTPAFTARRVCQLSSAPSAQFSIAHTKSTKAINIIFFMEHIPKLLRSNSC